MSETATRHFNVPPDLGGEELKPDSIVSQSLLQNEDAKVIRFVFSKGQELSEHTATVAALLQQVAGECEWGLGGETHHARPGDWVYMPPNLKHSLRAKEDCVVLLILLRKSGAAG